jgi:putative acetyltransferase
LDNDCGHPVIASHPESARPSVGGVRIRPETTADHDAIDTVQRRAFGSGERIPALVAALRAAPATLRPRGYVAVDRADRVVGHVMLSAGRLDAPRRLVDVYVLSPLGVHPDHQMRGIGTLLVAHALAEADRVAIPLLFLEGSPDYYGERGFEPATPLAFRKPSLRIPDPAFQVARLSTYEPWMTGTLVYSEVFWALDCVGLRGPQG